MRDPLTWATYDKRMRPLVPIFLQAHTEGIRVDQSRAQEALSALQRVCEDATLHAQAWAGYPLNLGSPSQVVWHLANINKIKGIRSVEAEHVADLLLKHPDNELLRQRRRWAQAEGFRRYVAAIAEQERVYPEFLPTQATGRISVTNPPLVNFPDDGKAAKRGLPPLRGCFIPDEGHWWLCWDWSSMHARFMAAVSNDMEDLEAYRTGADLHRLTAARIFRIPPEQVDQRQRHLAKTTRYALLNGLDSKAVREAKEVVEQGLDMDELEKVARQFLAAKPAMTRWKQQYATDAIQRGEARSLFGRKRRLVGSDWREKAKAAISGFLQMTESDILTETIIEVARRYPAARLVFTSHDGAKFQFPNRYSPNVVLDEIRPWVQREHRFGVNTISLPAEFEIVYSDGSKIGC